MTTEADAPAPATTPAADAAPAAAAAPSAPEGGSILGEQPGAITPPADATSPDAAQPGTETKAPDAPVVPEKYEFTPPEGFTVDPEALSRYEGLAKDAGLTQEQFAKVTEYGLKYFHDQLGKQAEAQDLRVGNWMKDTLADGEIADGKTLRPEAREAAARVLERFGGDDLRKALVETGAGNHPAIVRAFISIGKAMGVASPPDTGNPVPQTAKGNGLDDIAARMYGNGA
ncbi:hypothetical protein LV478_11760 [Komagataeibacter oboediens]|uniref:hypothetical protein n=1 Tax=Komagataeibacter oboediens TaxID=65958 RepID=UPI0023DBFB71|nr:hypothetical protein [Komagataeibacter oboediens]WEQ51206.1 hypothetical protein LV478_11760 [Komagataeibacter oboediens]